MPPEPRGARKKTHRISLKSNPDVLSLMFQRLDAQKMLINAQRGSQTRLHQSERQLTKEPNKRWKSQPRQQAASVGVKMQNNTCTLCFENWGSTYDERVMTSASCLQIQLSPAVCSSSEQPTVLGFGSGTAPFSLAQFGSIMEQIAASNADLQNTFAPFLLPIPPYNRLNHASQTPTGDTVIILAIASQGAI